MIEELKAALESLVAALIREGVEINEAMDEASDFVSIPSGKRVSEREMRLFTTNLGASSLSSELLQLVSDGQIQGAAVWDVDFRSGGEKDDLQAFLEFVKSSTSAVREASSDLPPGVAIGACGDVEWVWVIAEGGVCLVDHEDGSSFRVAGTLREFVSVNARLAASYYSLLNRGDRTEDWADLTLRNINTEGVDQGWLEHSLLSRPRPE